ncbi:ATP-dependent helicase HrpB [Pseudosulfitobacter pseudonitzschiae]|uniref:ATP-dependent helicase HrpB n=1 Tax=Pseudosulfitobacter pseudonitzschiae TaxID=1402135 RepID=UPI001AF9F6AB|nr:ATP-dependent helicase HrpB [Pseudosulfitobacter pseudonitzschiae]MBM1815039.1 ATP-dependent helicase HrpB [Pseudosulfitobacter pseudonitzschiae]MBM1832030.1 ATP-dependent helicase HrpB [Pseudosulfitobacter pseudonitzschiae]MBM1836898.1 ATP-dependent helicase HrpB [Pseudosulfitobacter pseudonitzschiae]MBM1841744.1 ATP-dependent helicase HrpB [Pseudosulfitobacter pseudonitzschiae]MBM1846612.1 ATP-dependent helicase HrpB [Pseudosulfitobacter pseudonitzschiae]
MTFALPIDDVLDAVCTQLAAHKRLVLQAPPGAGKTTRVPLALMEAGFTGRIVMLEPRRLAARTAAERMAETLGETVGETVGYRVRGETKVGKTTRIEVVTEGILTRMIQSDPDLPGVGVVIFDEFHERSLNADLGLALCLEVAEALRDDLHLVVMSATLDAAPVAEMLNAPLVTSEGRAYEVTPHWLDRPRGQARLEGAVADLIRDALRAQAGSALVFLPGEGEIRRVQGLLDGSLGSDVAVHPLFGAMDFAAQRAAIAPAKTGRKVVLATAIAETSLTLPDIRIVVDAGLARRARFDPSSGMSRLVTERVTRAEATQRAGRAGRVAAGHCYKLWTRGEDGALAAFPPAEIEAGDLTGMALELALWGATPEELSFVTPPHPGRYGEAVEVLRMLEALDDAGRITAHGRALSGLPLHPRLAHMLVRGGAGAADLAALLAERDILRGMGSDLRLRMLALRSPDRFGNAVQRGALARVRQEAKRLKSRTSGAVQSLGAMAALAYPDRIGLRRKGDAPRFVLSGGKGAVLPDGDALAGARLIVATDLDGDPREAKIRQATEISDADLRATFGDAIAWHDVCMWSKREGHVLARQQERLGALVLEDRAWRDAPPEDIAVAMLDGVRQLGLLPSAKAARFLARARLVDADDWSDDHLITTLEDWLLPHLGGVRTAADWKAFELTPALKARLDWDAAQALDRAVPSHFTTPLGRNVPIDYSGDAPEIAVRLQEMFGITRHPTVAGKPLKVTLLSPAHRPIQITMDLPGFWASSYADVRKDMRGQYPKHPWPEDPTQEDPTLRAKRRT